jgi:hypothetical protein
MINLLPEPKKIREDSGFTEPFKQISLKSMFNVSETDAFLEIVRLRLWNYQDIVVSNVPGGLVVTLISSLDGIQSENERLFREQGYRLTIKRDGVTLQFAKKAGFINGITSLKQLLVPEKSCYTLPLCEITDYPSLPVRAVAPTFSWYAGYGRIGFDSQFWGLDQWTEFLNHCLDNKINQMNMVMYGYWPFEFEKYPETVFRNIPLKIWLRENNMWLTVHYTHPNLEEAYLAKFIALAHKLEVKIFAYVGLNSYNGAYTIKHPEARQKPPKTGGFLNDFDSVCLSYPGTVDYIIDSMTHIVGLGFDGFTFEESEEGFWYCECKDCKERWHKTAASPGEAKHRANFWLLNRIYEAVRKIKPNVVIGIRAFRQPPLEKDPAFLKECVDSMPPDIMLFWAPGLYVPETEFPKWCDAFGRDRIWARDTESNAITSTMGRLFRVFESNLLRYSDETCKQNIERDIEQHLGSVKERVHGINGFMFEWYGLFMHLFVHGNYGWGSSMAPKEFFERACELNFGRELGRKVLYVLRNILTIHESQIPLYTTPFPFQKNRITEADIPAIKAAQNNHPHIMEMLDEIRGVVAEIKHLRHWLTHFDKIQNAERRNAVIYKMALAALHYAEEQDPRKKDVVLDEILELNEKDFGIAKEMFFDLNPVDETGVKSCMFPYHEIKRLIYNIRHPASPDKDIICSGVEAFGWLWL